MRSNTIIQEIFLSSNDIRHILSRNSSIYLNRSTSASSNYSIIAYNPFLSISIHDHSITTTNRSGLSQTVTENPLTFLDNLIHSFPSSSDGDEVPTGGLYGAFSYEFSRYMADYDFISGSTFFPDFIGGLYDNIIVIDHQSNKQFHHFTPHFDPKHTCSELPSKHHSITEFKLTPPQSTLTKSHYLETINTIQHYIKQGDVYQINYSTPFISQFTGCPLHLYQELCRISPAPYSAYVHFNDTYILSSSPELFFKKQYNHITTRPIKGTAARSHINSQDLAHYHFLKQSQKDIAELTMITDLERNDLSKICQVGTVNVDRLRDIETYPQVFHGVSTISGTLLKHVSFIDIFKALFPGGSITGAPKIRAMELINQLEHQPRGFYTGCIGYWDLHHNAEFNIAIRTSYTHQNHLYFHSGGGITFCSDPLKEWDEVLAKAKGFTLACNYFQ